MFVPLLSYLGDQKYEKICRTVFNISGKIPLKNMKFDIMHDLFVEIIKIIKYFSLKAVDKNLENIQKVSQLLNDSGRESYLFNCLMVPSDKVRLQIVSCLMAVEINQWDSQEISQILQICTQYKNLGAGETEKVLSNIFMIVARFLKCTKNKNSLLEFIDIHAENSVKECTVILIKNMQRNLLENPQENEQKVELAWSCVNFLQCFQSNFDLRDQNLLTPQMGQVLKNCLQLENKFLEDKEIPIQIEQIYTGKYLEYLMPLIYGKDKINPYKLQSFRILNRIANNFMDSSEEQAEDLSDFKSAYDFKDIKQKIIENLTRKKFIDYVNNFEQLIPENLSLKEKKVEYKKFKHYKNLQFTYKPVENQSEKQIREDIVQNLTSFIGTLISACITKRVQLIREIIKPEYFPSQDDTIIEIRKTFLQLILDISAIRSFQNDLNIYMKKVGEFSPGCDDNLDLLAHVYLIQQRKNKIFHLQIKSQDDSLKFVFRQTENIECFLACTSDQLFLYQFDQNLLKQS
ncbi:hypothetical protein PPERSA_03024 [Pseudocohnilembus persalinus]|uniref:Uncharacterized protein n=1 Tax=Pseudocohnilembus persalinus TaxID=266149 RepID=A0A0V0QF04_PSEPJ|nr:hypothetical protein PPERSA_03024 [Pseudocohnilembus persalinus]|eukprot:KRX00764.1 hypothetical protein PPERSA_03024 [Pseudocohnilembus persalinus]